jgi:hypothetical protein
MAKDIGIARSIVVWVEPDDNQTGCMNGDLERHPVDSVGQENRHTVAGLKSLSCESSAELMNAEGNRLPAVVAPILGDRIVVSISDVGRAAPDTLAEQPPHCTRLLSADYVSVGG